MAAKTRLLVVSHFEGHAPGDRIVSAAEIERVLETHPDYVLREAVAAETAPTKAEVKAAGVGPDTEARVAAGLPAGPLPAADEAKSPKTTRVTINDKG